MNKQLERDLKIVQEDTAASYQGAASNLEEARTAFDDAKAAVGTEAKSIRADSKGGTKEERAEARRNAKAGLNAALLAQGWRWRTVQEHDETRKDGKTVHIPSYRYVGPPSVKEQREAALAKSTMASVEHIPAS